MLQIVNKSQLPRCSFVETNWFLCSFRRNFIELVTKSQPVHWNWSKRFTTTVAYRINNWNEFIKSHMNMEIFSVYGLWLWSFYKQKLETLKCCYFFLVPLLNVYHSILLLRKLKIQIWFHSKLKDTTRKTNSNSRK